MHSWDYFIGVDISKATLDIALVQENKVLWHLQTENTPQGIARFIKSLAGYKIAVEKTLFCMEHTGIYSRHLLHQLKVLKASIWLEAPVQLKRSLGLQRGKSDKVDAQRIALYAYKSREDAQLWEGESPSLMMLKQLSGHRKRLIKALRIVRSALSETAFMTKEEIRLHKQCSRSSEMAILKDIKRVEEQMHTIIKEAKTLWELFKLITSVPGVGPNTAIELLVCTHQFGRITDARKFACYAGIAPFEHRSGTSIRGKTRVSPMANKDIKTLLHMCAVTATQCNKEIRVYYERKLLEGKNKMLVLNAIRNKLVHRIFACVRDKRMYQTEFVLIKQSVPN